MKKKRVFIVLGLILIIILSIILGLFYNVSKVGKEGKNLFKQVIVGEDDDYVYVSEDFMKMLQDYFKNKDIIGYIDYEEAGISYPIVKSSDNNDYLRKDIHGNFSIGGSIFLDCNSKEDFSSVNSVIYGHHMRDGSMFGKLEGYIQENGIESEKFYIYTKDGRIEYDCISSEVFTPSEENAEKLILGNRETFLGWISELSSNIKYEYEGNDVVKKEGLIDYSKDTKNTNFATLVTCHYTGFSTVRFGLTAEYKEIKEYKVKE